MAHEITRTDAVAIVGERGWHGLGIELGEAQEPIPMLATAKMDWTVDQRPLYTGVVTAEADGEGYRYDQISEYQANVRSDTGDVLGIVGRGYQPIQNLELAEFCAALAEQGDKVKCETAGSIRGGKKVWFLLRGESFSVRKDEVIPYILVSNGHDGGTALRCTPTTVKVVCSNTLHMVIPSKFSSDGTEKLGQSVYIAHHTGTIMSRLEEAKAALGLYGKSLEKTREVIDVLAARDINSEAVKRFFLECFARDFGPIPTIVTNEKEERKKLAAMDAVRGMKQRFEEELELNGATVWNAMNAVTGYYQNKPSRMKDAIKSHERKVESKLFGVDADRAHSTLLAALALAI